MAEQSKSSLTRREAVAMGIRGAGLLAFGGALGALAFDRRVEAETVWQIDPEKCIQCEKCATECVLNPSAVKCVNVFPLCGYCDLCTGYYIAQPAALDTAAENQLCPTGALIRRWVEDLYFEYTIDVDKCIGCARCVKGCYDYGNGSLFLQIDQERCVRCNRCSIAAACPSRAISRVSANKPYILRTRTRTG